MKRTASQTSKSGYDVSIPDSVRVPNADPWKFAYHITGEKKIGKTTFCIASAENPKDAFVWQFDKPNIGYPIREKIFDNWRHVTEHLTAVEAAFKSSGTLPFNRLVIDDVGAMYNMCQDRVCKIENIKHPSDLEWGKGWAAVRKEFESVIMRLLRLQDAAEIGLIFLSHCEWRDIRKKGQKQAEMKLMANLPSQCEKLINGKVDGWFAYDYYGDDRFLTVRGDESVGAGERMNAPGHKSHFFTPDGRAVRHVYMGRSAEEGVANFLAAYNNEQNYVTMKERRESRRSKTTKRTKKRRTRK